MTSSMESASTPAQPPAIYLCLVLHNHQPVGQLDHIAEHSTHVSYIPMIEALERHPTIKVGMHYSGALLEWLKKRNPEVIDRLRALVQRGQIEMLSGGYYEPMLVALPDEDKIGQIERMNTELYNTLGGNAAGLWLAERVWEPHLARHIARAGLRYVILDDSHFENVGFKGPDDLFGYYITEEQGYPLAVLPTLSHLRYSVPWKSVETLREWLRAQADHPLPNPRIAVMGDNGEKFGTWTGTFERCWGDGKYIETLFDMLEQNHEWIASITPHEYLNKYPPLGRAYLPATSYSEMSAWSLPAEAANQLKTLKTDLKRRTGASRFLTGGMWRGFMVRYPEINHMHKRMMMISKKIGDMRRGRKRDHALELLWAGQCNDAYWHGLFGGVYLFNLRVAVYANLIGAEDIADEDTMYLTRTDFDFDGHEEVILNGSPLHAVWSPVLGGALLELDYRPVQYNLTNVISRRLEAYHTDLVRAAGNGTLITPLSPQSPRDDDPQAIRAKEPDLEKCLIYDWHQRASFLDHFLGPWTTLDEFYRAQYAEQGDFVNQPYTVVGAACDGDTMTLHMQRDGHVWIGEVHYPVRVHKSFHMVRGEPTVRVTYTVSQYGEHEIDLRFGVETVVGFDGGNDPKLCALVINGQRRELSAIREIEAVTRYSTDSNLRNLTLTTDLGKPAFLWQFPLETVTLSEAGFERDYQGTVFLHLWKVHLRPSESWQVTVTQSVQQTATRP
jgi:4-alpha-glucanotransferase